MTTQLKNSRYGFYYYPDALHYRDSDLRTWLPELQALGAGWLTLRASPDRAIPEDFLQPLLEAGIQPVIHLPLSTNDSGISEEVAVLLEAYSHWGVRYIALFDRPNQKFSWTASTWAQVKLVDRFLDKFVTVAEAALAAGLAPLFPPLEPGGDYWDTAFLFSALEGLQQRGAQALLSHLVLSAYAWAGNRSPNWGAGGPERWPSARPYATPENSEDQLGFRIFDWYLAISQAALGITLPIILLGAGSRIGDHSNPISPAVDSQAHASQNMAIVRMMQGQMKEYDPIPAEVLACNFWVLSAAPNDPDFPAAWYPSGQQPLPVVGQLKQWVASGASTSSTSPKIKSISSSRFINPRPIDHYLLLPTFEWGVADWHLDAIRPFIKKYQPTIGFSPQEAAHAKRVTVIGGATAVPEAILDELLAAGCVVEQISGDGMNIASTKASRS